MGYHPPCTAPTVRVPRTEEISATVLRSRLPIAAMTSSRCEEHSLTTEISLSTELDTPHSLYSSVDMSNRMSDGEDNIADDDSAYGEDSLIGDDTITLSTYITDYRYEYGRRYHSYRDGAYWVGCSALRALSTAVG